MQLQVKLHGVTPDRDLNARIRRLLTDLERRYPEVYGCRVHIDHVPPGEGTEVGYRVQLEVGADGERVRIEGKPDPDVAVALRKTFERARGELKDRFSPA